MSTTTNTSEKQWESERRYLYARLQAAEVLNRYRNNGEEQFGQGVKAGPAEQAGRGELRRQAVEIARLWYRNVAPQPARRCIRITIVLYRGVKKLFKSIHALPVRGRRRRENVQDEQEMLRRLLEHTPPEEERLKEEYQARGLDKMENTFVLYRIIGNDLYPRHRKGQSRENVRFILEHEEEFPGCEKRWIVNRIGDPQEREAIIELLEQNRQSYTEIPFRGSEFCAVEWDITSFPRPGFLSSPPFLELDPRLRRRAYTAAYRRKNNYVMNNNGARNTALDEGRGAAKWVLPFDGNCFLTPSGWEELRKTVTANPHLRFFVVPMERVPDNTALLSGGAGEPPAAEPQLLFRFDAEERFNEAHPYGRRPKVELLKRLQVPGPWEKWRDDPWDQPGREASPEAGVFRAAGRVARLASGVDRLEAGGKQALIGRGLARQEGICTAINTLTREYCGNRDELGLASFFRTDLDMLREQYAGRPSELQIRLMQEILVRADRALKREPASVIDKQDLPPSGDRQDYYHPAPYWWPDPDTRDGMPYIQRDGERVPGTSLYEPESSRYDRTRLQYLFDDGTTLALAWYISGDDQYADHAARWFRRWFIEEETRMNPHLRYAQVRWGHDENRGQPRGIIEMKDLYYYLDAVRLLGTGGKLSVQELDTFSGWLTAYLEWLQESPQGKGECSAVNNHGTYYDLQTASIAAFLEDDTALYRTLIRARDRVAVQYSPEGVPVEEIVRTQTAHYCCFNLQGWLNLAEMARLFGDDLAHYRAPEGAGLQQAVTWLAAHYRWPWPYQQIEPFDADRFIPLFALAERLDLDIPISIRDDIERTAGSKPCFHPHDGIRPFWAVDVSELITIQ